MRPELVVGLGFGLALAPPALVVQAQTAEEIYAQGVEAYRSGDYVEAAERFAEVVRLEPNNSRAYIFLGSALGIMGQLDRAVEAFQRAIELDPDYAFAYNNLGIALRAQGDLAGAIASYERAIELDPGDAVAYNNLGIALRDQGDLAGAIASYERAIELDPDYAFAYNNLGVALRDQGDLAGAIASYERAIELDPDYAVAYNNLGVALRDQGDLAGAIASYERAIELDPDYAVAYNNLGNALSDQGDLSGAIASYERAIELDPDDAVAYNNWGYLLYTQGDYTGAIAKYEAALAIDPNLTATQTNLAEAQRRLQEQISGIPNLQDELAWLPLVEEEPLLPTLRSVVLIASTLASGSGFERGTGWVVKKEGDRLWILTNRHVVWDEAARRTNGDVEVEFFSEPPPGGNRLRLPARIVEITGPDDEIDLALLVVDNAPTDIQPLPMAPAGNRLARESPVRVVGHPSTGLPWTVDEGLVSNRSVDKLQISQASLAAGSSGSPVLDETNRVVAVVVEVSNPGEVASTAGFGFAYRLTYLVEVLVQWGIEVEP